MDGVQIGKRIESLDEGVGNQVFKIRSGESSRQVEAKGWGALVDIQPEELVLHLGRIRGAIALTVNSVEPMVKERREVMIGSVHDICKGHYRGFTVGANVASTGSHEESM